MGHTWIWLVACFALAIPASTLAQRPLQSVIGTVRDTANRPLAGAEAVIGERRATSNADGVFRIDSLSPGRYPITVRLIGYRPVRSVVPVLAGEPTRVEYYLFPEGYRLPSVEVTATRRGIYGFIGDIDYRPIAGARVDVLGFGGGDALTDGAGRFAFPKADRGLYVVRVTKAGYGERRLGFEIERGKGKELGIRLTPAPPIRNPNETAQALFDLGRRLAMGRRWDRIGPADLARYGSLSVCEVPRIRAWIGIQQAGWLNGTTQLLPGQVCAWQMNELDLVEFTGGSASRALGQSSWTARAVIIWERW